MERPGERGASEPESVEPRPELDQKKRRRKDEEPEPVEAADEPSEEQPEPEEPEVDEATRRAIAAEAAFRERVALQELVDRLPERSAQAISEALERVPGRWSVERGRHVFSRLVGEREVTIQDQPVQVEHRISLLRDEAPPTEPDEIERKLIALFKPDVPPEKIVAQLEPLRAELAEGDEVTVEAPDSEPVIITSDEVRVVRPAAAEQTPRPLPIPTQVERAVQEIVHEPLGLAEPLELAEPALERPTPIRQAVAVLEREAVDLNELPVIAGGAAEADEAATEEPPEREPEFFPEELELPEEAPELSEAEAPEPTPPAPVPDRERPKRPRRQKSPKVIVWEPGWPEAIMGPDVALRKKARKLIRRLAAEYHVRLTPNLEAYLLAILLRPGVVNGRKVYSLGFNVETAIRVMSVLAAGGYARPRP